MIDCLIQGKLFAAPQQRTSKAGKPFATAKLIAAAGGVAFVARDCRDVLRTLGEAQAP